MLHYLLEPQKRMWISEGFYYTYKHQNFIIIRKDNMELNCSIQVRGGGEEIFTLFSFVKVMALLHS